ncbi:hypothetical protein PSAL108031_25090 [Ectopseudomonas alcaliphila]
MGVTVAVAHRIAIGAQAELVGQTKRAVPVEAQAPLLLAGAFLAVVVAVEPGTPGFVALALQADAAAAYLFARHQLQLGLARRQAVELVDQLLQFAQVQHFAGLAGETHGQFTITGQLGAVQPFQAAFDHDDP